MASEGFMFLSEQVTRYVSTATYYR